MGGAIVRRLLADGCTVYASDLSGRRLAELETSVAGSGDGWAGGWKADATKRDACADLVARAGEAMGGVDVLVNVVGGYRGALYEPLVAISDERFDSAVDMTLRSPFLLTQLCAPAMLDRGWGRVVNVASIAMNGAAGQADYAALKAGVVGLTRSCALELAPDVNVNAVVPGVIDTQVMERMDPEVLERYRGRIPLGRWGRPDEVAAAVSFLASEDASYITGEDLYVSGGFRSWL
jgi:NAD(P)-dependent dehydrogenase (short-subunit alcohol dehydrogenase family)